MVGTPAPPSVSDHRITTRRASDDDEVEKFTLNRYVVHSAEEEFQRVSRE